MSKSYEIVAIKILLFGITFLEDAASQLILKYTIDDSGDIYVDGKTWPYQGNAGVWYVTKQAQIPYGTHIVAFTLKNSVFNKGLLASYDNGWSTGDLNQWRCTDITQPNDNWKLGDYDDSNWETPTTFGNNGVNPWGVRSGISTEAKWIWTNSEATKIYCRHNLPHNGDCTTPSPTVNNAHIVNIEGTIHEDVTVTYTCDSGFEVANFQKTCDGSDWTGQGTNCKEIQCGHPQTVASSKTSLSNGYNYQSILQYKCDYGYEMVSGDSAMMCTQDKQWSSQLPVCQEIRCNTPQDVPNSKLTLSDGTRLQSVLQYICNDGHELVSGDAVMICNKDKLWSGQLPVCEAKTCSFPSIAPYSITVLTGLSYMDNVTYTCISGYKHVSGDVFRKCQANKQWSGITPVCEEILCPDPVTKVGIVSSYNRTIYLSTLNQTCQDGYKWVSGDSSRMCLVNGSWSGKQLDCEEVECTIPFNISNASILTLPPYKYNSTVIYNCGMGYEATGDSLYRRCTEDGTWSDSLLNCTELFCASPLDVPNSKKVLTRGYHFQSVLQYKCDEGYEMVSGDAVMLCSENKKWTGESPTCQVIKCSYPVVAPYSSVNVTGLSYMDIARYTCDHDYLHKTGNLVRICDANKSWNGTTPGCQIRRCPVPKQIKDTTFNIRKMDRVEMAIYKCKYGYELHSVSNVKTCTIDNMTWQGDDAICKLSSNTIALPKDPEPETQKQRILKSMGMLEVDLSTESITYGSVIGIVLIGLICTIIVSLDILTLKKEYERLKRNLRY